MTRFGDELRQQREARGVRVEEICAATKVSAQNVLALEAGEFGQMPGGVFRRGIVRSYLSAVGLDEAVWMERFEASCRELGLGVEGERDWVEFAQNVKRNRTGTRKNIGWRWVGVAVMVAALVGLGWLAWHFVREHRASLQQDAAVSKSCDDRMTIGEIGIDIARGAFFTNL